MRNKLLVLAVLLLGINSNASMAFGQDFPITVQEVPVPREEMRQQILQGIKEYRYSYSFTKVPMQTCFFAECYTEGKFTRRFMLTSSMSWNQEKYGQGTLSLGWNYRTRELVLIEDNGFGLWNSRFVIPEDIFDRPSVVVCAKKTVPEIRDTPTYYPKRNTIYPILGLVGSDHYNKTLGKVTLVGKTHFSLTSAGDFVSQTVGYGAKHCLIIYAFSSDNGGNPPFDAENGNSFYIGSLPMN